MYIPKDLEKDVKEITTELIKYKNTNKLSWLKSYEEVLKKLNMENKVKDNRLLTYVVRGLSEKFYIIDPEPFKLLTDDEYYKTLNNN